MFDQYMLDQYMLTQYAQHCALLYSGLGQALSENSNVSNQYAQPTYSANMFIVQPVWLTSVLNQYAQPVWLTNMINQYD